MTNVEALKKLYQQVGGDPSTLDANTNLELLNAITEALGGEPDATENAKGIDNVAAVASGGGDYKTHHVEFTVTNNSNTSSGLIATFDYPTVDESGKVVSASATVEDVGTGQSKVLSIELLDIEGCFSYVDIYGVQDSTECGQVTVDYGYPVYTRNDVNANPMGYILSINDLTPEIVTVAVRIDDASIS